MKKVVSIIAVSLLSCLTAALNVTAFCMRDVLDVWGSTERVDVDENQASELSEQKNKLAKDIEAEGLVLAENNGTLPLDKTAVSKVNVFGWSSTSWIFAGSGSGRSNTLTTDFLGALKDAEIEYNTSLTDMYSSFLSKRPYYDNNTGSLHSYSDDFSVLYEPSINDRKYYTDEMLQQAKAYSDTAVVVISRVTGESDDAPKIQHYVNDSSMEVRDDENKTYLDLSEDEEALLSYVGSNYDKVVVLVNSTNAMNLSFTKTIPGIDACMVVGTTGEDAATEIVSAIYGDINPSGRLTDTYAYDLKSNPSYFNSGISETDMSYGRYLDAEGVYPADGTSYGNVGDNAAKYSSPAFTCYEESIYVGYKYYETADAEGIFDDVSNDFGKGYDGVVEYPFGYGLSYTSFQQEIISAVPLDNSKISYDDEIKVTVRVTNTGEKAGKDAVQLYLTRPYTKGGIEKSAVELADFGKTDTLNPKEHQDVELTVKVSDFVSYDDYDKNGNGFKGYELEKGDYILSARKNSHEVYSKLTYTVQDEKQVEGVTNQFDAATSKDGFSIDGSNAGMNLTYLSRSDMKATFPKTVASVSMISALKDKALYTASDANAYINNEDQPVTFGKDNGYKIYTNKQVTDIGYQLGNNYDDPLWEDVLDQITKEQMEAYVLHAYVHTEKVTKVGKPKTKEVDGPSQVGGFGGSGSGKGYPNPVVLAQTFNKELAYQYGKLFGQDAILLGYDGLYAPGCNIHRSAFGGRNYEYYSEDSYLSGIMASYTVRGIYNTGIYVYMKHFICDEQEIYRDGMYTWMNEQSLREIYLRPFKMSIDIGGLNGVMTSYNRLGATWAGGNYNLLTNVLRNEWGFKGAVITDYADHHSYMNMDQAIRAGGTLFMDGWLNDGDFLYETSSNTFDQCLRKATKDNLYQWLNTKARGKNYSENGDKDFEANISVISSIRGETNTWWVKVLVAIDVVLVLAILAIVFFGLIRKPKKAK